MAMKRKRFDKDLKENGKWFTYEEGTVDECKVKIASWSNANFIKAYGEYSVGEKSTEEFARIVAETILLDWEGFEEDDGTAIPYSVEEGVAFLLEDAELQAFIINTMQEKDAYRREIQTKKAKK